jgi:type IV pilus assembly protein PilP
MRRALALLAPFALAACGSGMADLEQYVAEVKSRKTDQIEPIPQIKQYEAFAYVGGERRNPFVRAEPARDSAADANAVRPDVNRNPEPLEEFPLDGLRMLGTINSGNTVYGLVKAPDNVVHRVTRGNHMGQNYGRITGISESQVDLIEIIPDGFGGFMERPATLALSQ